MPIVDISGLSMREVRAKNRIRERIQSFCLRRFHTPMSATKVTFITDETAGTGPSVHVIARLYSKKFMTMRETELDEFADAIVLILEEEAGHSFNEVLPIPVLTIRGRHYTPITVVTPKQLEMPITVPGVPNPDWRSRRAFKGQFIAPAVLMTEEIEEFLQGWTRIPEQELRKLLVTNTNKPTSMNYGMLSGANKTLLTKSIRGKYYRLVTEQGMSCLWHVIPA